MVLLIPRYHLIFNKYQWMCKLRTHTIYSYWINVLLFCINYLSNLCLKMPTWIVLKKHTMLFPTSSQCKIHREMIRPLNLGYPCLMPLHLLQNIFRNKEMIISCGNSIWTILISTPRSPNLDGIFIYPTYHFKLINKIWSKTSLV